MASTGTAPKSRRRGAQLEAAILDATWAELSEVGYSRLTIEAIATRAGTSKPVIYRRWANRAELVLAAWSHQGPHMSRSVPDTGALRGDLVALFTRVARLSDRMMNEMLAGVMGEAFRHPEVGELLRARMRNSPLFETISTIVGRAVDRGELPPVQLSARITRIPLDLIRTETMTFCEPLGEDSIAELVDDVYLPLLYGLGMRRAAGAA